VPESRIAWPAIEVIVTSIKNPVSHLLQPFCFLHERARPGGRMRRNVRNLQFRRSGGELLGFGCSVRGVIVMPKASAVFNCHMLRGKSRRALFSPQVIF
jgi:hypothetical protein